jgi:predicted nicotinamide N-methyase
VIFGILYNDNVKAVSMKVRCARAGASFIVFDARHARVSRFSKQATAMKPAFKETVDVPRARS